MSLWFDAMTMGVAAVTTLSIRVPQLVAGTMTPRERHRMVGEKVAATTEGVVQGALAMNRLAARRPRLHNPLEDGLRVAEAMIRPARRRVVANAKRLSRTPKP